MSRHILPDRKVLRSLLDYDPATGALTWKRRSKSMFIDGPRFGARCIQRRWNTRYAGRAAFVRTNGSGYRAGKLFHSPELAHRVIWKWMTGDDPDIIDHVNGDRCDNRWANLRSTDGVGNARNSALPRTNTSGHIGVSFNKAQRRWVSYICGPSARKHLGSYSTKEAAIAARISAQAEHGFHPNHGRRSA